VTVAFRPLAVTLVWGRSPVDFSEHSFDLSAKSRPDLIFDAEEV
jgi:hypothetical protein